MFRATNGCVDVHCLVSKPYITFLLSSVIPSNKCCVGRGGQKLFFSKEKLLQILRINKNLMRMRVKRGFVSWNFNISGYSFLLCCCKVDEPNAVDLWIETREDVVSMAAFLAQFSL